MKWSSPALQQTFFIWLGGDDGARRIDHARGRVDGASGGVSRGVARDAVDGFVPGRPQSPRARPLARLELLLMPRAASGRGGARAPLYASTEPH